MVWFFMLPKYRAYNVWDLKSLDKMAAILSFTIWKLDAKNIRYLINDSILKVNVQKISGIPNTNFPQTLNSVDYKVEYCNCTLMSLSTNMFVLARHFIACSKPKKSLFYYLRLKVNWKNEKRKNLRALNNWLIF